MLFGPVVYFLSRMVGCLQVHRYHPYLAWVFSNAIQCNDRTNKGTSFSRSIQTIIRHQPLQEKARKLWEQQLKTWQRLDNTFQKVRCTINFVSNM